MLQDSEADRIPVSRWLVPLFWLALCCISTIFVAAGLPFVFNDDAYMALPAIEYAAGRGLSAPALAAQFPEFYQNFLVYPPGFTVGLAGWVAAFGHGSLSFSVFAALSGLVCTLLLYRVLERVAPDAPLRWVAPLIALPACIYQGMRPELLGYPLFLLGCWLLLARPGAVARVVASLALGLSTLCAPTLLGPALLVLVFDLARLRGADRASLVRAGLALCLGGLLAAAALLWMVQGQLLEFISQFTQHARERRTAPGLNLMLMLYLTLVAASAVILGLGRLLRAQWSGVDTLIAWLSLALLLSLVTHARQTLSVSLTNLLLLGLLWRASGFLPWPRLARLGGGAAMAGFAGFLLVANVYAVSKAPYQRFAPGDAARLQAFIAATPPGDRLVVSPVLFRTLLDGQWPAGAQDLYFLRYWREGHLPEGLADFLPRDRIALTNIDVRTIIQMGFLRAGDGQAFMAPLRDGSGATEAPLPNLVLRLTVPVQHGLPPRRPLRLCLMERPDPSLAGLSAAEALVRICGGVP